MVLLMHDDSSRAAMRIIANHRSKHNTMSQNSCRKSFLSYRLDFRQVLQFILLLEPSQRPREMYGLVILHIDSFVLLRSIYHTIARYLLHNFCVLYFSGGADFPLLIEFYIELVPAMRCRYAATSTHIPMFWSNEPWGHQRLRSNQRRMKSAA
jgi:hypothetical protein